MTSDLKIRRWLTIQSPLAVKSVNSQLVQLTNCKTTEFLKIGQIQLYFFPFLLEFYNELTISSQKS